MSTRAVLQRWPLVAVVVLAGCMASQGVSPEPMSESRSFSRLDDAVASLTPADDDDAGSGRPRVHLTVLSGASTARYIETMVSVPTDAYVMVVAVDLDRRVRVVFPEKPEESGFLARSNSTRLTRFFAGFGQSSHFGRYSSVSFLTQPFTPFGGGGVLLAIASDQPLQFDRFIDSEGDWNQELLERVIFNSSAQTAVHWLGKALTVDGQEFGQDYSSFRGMSASLASFASNQFDCGDDDFGYSSYDGGYRSGYGFGVYVEPVVYFRRNGVTYAQYQIPGRCGHASYTLPVPIQNVPRNPRDTTRVDSVMTRTYRASLGSRMTPSLTMVHTPRTPVIDETGGVRDANSRSVAAGGIRSRPPEQVLRRPVGGVSVDDTKSSPRRERPHLRPDGSAGAANAATTPPPKAAPAATP